jgi:MFS family permease
MHEIDEGSPRYPGWRVAVASGLGVFLVSILSYAFSVLLKPLEAEFGWSRQAISSAYAVMAVTSALAAPLAGRWLDRFGPRRVMVPCLVVVGGAFASLAVLTARLWHLYLVFAVIGAAVVGATALGYSRAVSTWFDRRRGLALALVLAGGATGAIVHPPATQALIDVAGWRSACLALGAVMAAVGVSNVALFVHERPAARAAASPALAGSSVGEALSSRIFWTLILMVFGSTLAMNGAIVHLAPLLSDRGASPGRAAIAVSAMGGASLCGRLLTGWLLDRFSGPRVSCALLAVAALGTLLLAGAPGFALGVLAAVLIGAGSGGELDVAPYLLSRYFGLRSLSVLYGLTWTAMGLAGAAGPILLGRAFDTTGSYATLLVRFALAMLAIAALMLTLPAARRTPLAVASPQGA